MEQPRLPPPVWVWPGVLSLWSRCWREPPKGLGAQGDCAMNLQCRAACPHLLACCSPLERIQVALCLIHPVLCVAYSSRSLRFSVSLWGPLFVPASQWVMSGTLLCPYLQIETQQWFLEKAHQCSVQFSCSVMTDSLWPHGLQHASLPCPSPTPGAYSNLCPSSQWCHPTISSSIIPFFFCLQSFPASGSFPMSQFFTSVAKVLECQLQHE